MLRRFYDLASDLTKLPGIAPPGPSFADWERFLEDCRKAGLAAVDDRGTMPGALGYALLRRWRWLHDARKRGLDYATASTAFDAACERESDAFNDSMRRHQANAARSMRERDGKKRNPRHEASEIFDYATERGV